MMPIFLQILIFAAAFQTVSSGSLSTLYGEDGPYAILGAQASEDAEEDDRVDPFAQVAEPVFEATFPVSASSGTAVFMGAPNHAGSHPVRGPPLA